jgi:hypothetical protein
MDNPFLIGDPVQHITDRSKLGKVVGLIEPVFDCNGSPLRYASVLVRPAGKKFTTHMYDPQELVVCRCADRNPRERIRVHA